MNLVTNLDYRFIQYQYLIILENGLRNRGTGTSWDPCSWNCKFDRGRRPLLGSSYSKRRYSRSSAVKLTSGSVGSNFLKHILNSYHPLTFQNWPLWKKDLALFCICLNSAFAGILGPVISTVTAVMVKEFYTNFHHIEIFSGYPLFTSGVGALLASVGARLWGKRPAYLVCSALTFASTVWSAKATSLNSFLGARLVQGLGLGAFEGVVLSTIGDMYFVS